MFFQSLTPAGGVVESLRETWRILENLGGGRGGVNSFFIFLEYVFYIGNKQSLPKRVQ